MAVNPVEIEKFNKHASHWWDPDGPLKTLHHINPCRLDYICQQTTIANKKVLDVGCGAGILSESLKRAGANVTAIDCAADAIQVAITHAQQENLDIRYRCQAIEDLEHEHFDVIVCMELLEHLPDPAGFIQHCQRLLSKDGSLILSTINRTPKSYALAIVAAERILGFVPKGTHDYQQFIKPHELATWCQDAKLSLVDLTGMGYQPLTGKSWLQDDLAINYLAHARRQHADTI